MYCLFADFSFGLNLMIIHLLEEHAWMEQLARSLQLKILYGQTD